MASSSATTEIKIFPTALACALVDCLLASFHFFAFGKHYAEMQRLDALATKISTQKLLVPPRLVQISVR